MEKRSYPVAVRCIEEPGLFSIQSLVEIGYTMVYQTSSFDAIGELGTMIMDAIANRGEHENKTLNFEFVSLSESNQPYMVNWTVKFSQHTTRISYRNQYDQEMLYREGTEEYTIIEETIPIDIDHSETPKGFPKTLKEKQP